MIPRFLSTTDERISVEKVMQELLEEGDATAYMQIAALRYYLRAGIAECEARWRDRIQHQTCYSTLIARIIYNRPREDVCFVTFNYDTLLERALGLFDLIFEEITDISTYVSKSPFKLIKPHGSINWVRELDTSFEGESFPGGWNDERLARTIINNFYTLRGSLTDRYVMDNGRPAPRTISLATPTFPAIAIPVEKKSEFECPAPHLDVLRSHLPQVDKLVLIGWRGAERHFTELLAKHLPPDIPKHVIAGNNEKFAAETKENLESANVIGNFVCRSYGFRELVTEHYRDGQLDRMLKKD